jgi:hypothetical protein
MNYFHGNISMALNTYTANSVLISNLRVMGSNPKLNKNNLQVKKLQSTLQVFSIEKVEVQTGIQ